MKGLNEMSIRHVNSLRYNWKKIEKYIFFNPFMFVENTRSRLHHELRARNNHCGTIVQKIGISCTSFLCCIKDITETWNQMELNVRKSWAWLLIFLYWLHSLLQHESELIFAFLILTFGYVLFGWLPFRVGRTQ